MTHLEQLLADTLELVNKLRVEFGVKPLDKMPKGVPGEPCDCPTARALAPCGVVHVQCRSIQFDDVELIGKVERAWGGNRRHEFSPSLASLPDDLEMFIDRFDEGDYPELVDYPSRLQAIG